MSGYPLERLLQVRKFREDAAAAEIARCVHALEDAKQALVQHQKELEAYIAWRLKEEDTLFKEIQNKEISLSEVETYKQTLLSLRGKEVQYEERILEAEKHIEDCKVALEQARKARLLAMRERAKIEEHGERWQDEQRLLAERAEDLELEEFTGKSSEFDESASPEE